MELKEGDVAKNKNMRSSRGAAEYSRERPIDPATGLGRLRRPRPVAGSIGLGRLVN